MVRSPFILGLASVFIGLTGLIVVVSIAANSPVTIVAALPLGLTALIMWYHATGRLRARANPNGDDGFVDPRFGPRAEPGAVGFGGRATGERTQRDTGRFEGYEPGWYVDDDGQHWYIDADGHRWRIGPDGRRSRTVGDTAGPAGRAATGTSRQRVGGATGRGRRRVDPPGAARDALSRQAACDVLGIDPGADQETIHEAYRAKVKHAHPDTDGGSVEQFKAVTDAYERLTE